MRERKTVRLTIKTSARESTMRFDRYLGLQDVILLAKGRLKVGAGHHKLVRIRDGKEFAYPEILLMTDLSDDDVLELIEAS